MTFYNNRVVVIERKSDGLYLIKKMKNELHIDYIEEGSVEFQNAKLTSESVSEFDIDIDLMEDINIIYINDKRDLIMSRIFENKYETSVIIESIKKRIFDLLLINIGMSKNIFYMQATSDEHIYKIYHIYIEDGEQIVNLVDEVETYQIVNPLRVIKNDKNLILAYYYKNQICLKEFNLTTKIWSPSITLTSNQNKLYLDIIKVGDRLHLVYSDYYNDLFTIKYERFLLNDEYILKETEMTLSNNGNNTDPIMIYYGNKLWVIWKDTNQLLSIYSEDEGNTWSDIYQWKDTKRMDIVKYKYLTNIVDDKVKIDYSYGSINPDIKFIGFGDLKDAEVYLLKK